MSLVTDHELDAELNYLAYDGTRPVNYAYPAPDGIAQSSGKVAKHRVRIASGRALPERPELDRQGFELISHRTELRDFSDEAAIRALYYPETESLLRHATGAEKVLIFDHTVRLDQNDAAASGLREPVRRVHNDQTAWSAPRRVRAHLPPEEAEQRLRQRFAIINAWRPIGAPAETAPLAMCDARSIADEDLIATDLVYRHMVGETYSVQHNPNHRWYYFPKVQTDEVVLLKIYDSLAQGVARLSAHSAFDHPSPRPGAAPRRSIELRALVFWPATN
jgi:hypothetical protein